MRVPCGAPAGARADAEGWQARLALHYERARDSGRTTLARRTHHGPLRVQRPFYPEGPDVCHTLVLHPPGGMVGGDALEVHVALARTAHALVTTPGAAKWYRSAGALARQTVRLEVAAGARLEWLPQENIVFSGARAALTSRVELASGDARFLGWDVTCLGRPASAEAFAAGGVRQQLEVWRAGERLWGEVTRVEGGDAALSSPAGLDGAPVYGVLVAAGAPVPAAVLEACREVSAGVGRGGLTLLPGVLVARYLGPSCEEARRYFVALWACLRPALLGRAACPPRIWST